jgi:hypothetical protein
MGLLGVDTYRPVFAADQRFELSLEIYGSELDRARS